MSSSSPISFPESDVQMWLKKWDSLRPSEKEVADLLADGFSIVEIAQKRYISIYTVKNHIRSVFIKFDVHHQAELVARTWQVRYEEYKSQFNPCWVPCDEDCEIGSVHCVADHLPKHKWHGLMHTEECYARLRTRLASHIQTEEAS